MNLKNYHTYKYFIFIFVSNIFCAQHTSAQSISSSVISPTGASFKQDGFGLHFSVGEPLNTLIKGEESAISQGILQMHENSSDQNVSQSVAPQIVCPQLNVIHICAPVGLPAAMEFADFNPIDDQTAVANINFEVDDFIESDEVFTTITRSYIFTDSDGNSSSCEVVYHIANQFIEAPVINEQKALCESDFFSGIKLGNAQYRIYEDNDGNMGDLLRICDDAGLLCTAQEFGIDTDVPGLNKVWVTQFISFPDGSICESAATALSVEVLKKPEAGLSQVNVTSSMGSVINLMDFVTLNPTGYWTGEGVFSVETAQAEPLWIFSAKTTGLTKLYYTVSNQHCTESYLMIVDVQAGRQNAKPTPNYIQQSVQLYPNPVTDYLNINLPDAFDNNYKIQLFDANGALLKAQELNLVNSIDLRELQPGHYVLHLLQNEQTYDLLKVIKQ